jgi:hypothetical protein
MAAGSMVSLLGYTPEHLACSHGQENSRDNPVIDTPQGVVNAIFDYYEHKRFEPSEKEKLLELQAHS